MKGLIKKLLKEALLEIKDISPERETFSAYNGRYLFDVDMAYDLIKSKGVKVEIIRYTPMDLNQFSHPVFSDVNPEKLELLKKNLNLENPLGILVKFKNPKDKTHNGEWILIDGNHRARAAAELRKSGELYVIRDPKDVKKFMIVKDKIPHNLFPDDDIE